VGDDYVEVASRVVTDGHHALADAVRGVLDRSIDTTEVEVSAPRVGRHDDDRERWYAVRATPLRGRRPGAILIHTDVTERRRSLAELEVQAARDTLTGLVNRGTFVATLEAALAPGRVGDGRLALLFIDLDGFKPVNDTYGHSVGDEVLRAAARRIEAVVRATDTAARLGGDEFVVLIDPLVDRSIAEATADRILDALASPIHTDEHEISLGASIGVAVVDGPTRESAASLIRLADAAMYESKQLGGVRITIIDGDGEPLSAADPSPS
jgi:diguanylate cyclase (GGDEF)-like protein